MIVFWILSTLMLIAALLMVVPPLLLAGKYKPAARDALNVDIYRDQLNELQADLANQTLSPEQFAQGRLDLEHNLLADVSGDAAAERSNSARLGRRTAIVVGLAVPVVAIGIYMQLGKIGEAVAPPLAAVNPHADQTMANADPGNPGFSPEMMVKRLEAHLKTKPDDGQGWEMLGRSYRVTGHFADAAQAYGKAVKLQGEKADLMADYADVLGLSNPAQSLAGQPATLIDKVLKLDPDNPKGLWLAGMAAYQGQDFKGASDYWVRLSKAVPEGTQDAKVIKLSIADAQARAAGFKLAVPPR